MRVVFRVDSSSRIGAGHAVRCLTLAEALRDEGCGVVFLCRNEPGNISDRIRSRGIDVLELDAQREFEQGEDARGTIRALADWRADLVVVDHYRLGESWERAVRNVAPRLMVIDDLPERAHHCDFYLDQNVHGREAVRPALGERCVQMLGPKYALLRRQFAERRRADREVAAKVRSLVVCFGGGDHPEVVEKTLAALATMAPAGLATTVVVNGHIARSERLRALCDTVPGCEIRPGVEDMAALLAAADLVIGAGGVSSLERCCMGVPSLVLAIADNQLLTSAELARLGCQVFLGATQDVDDEMLVAGIRLLSGNAHLRAHLARRGMALVDGKGAQRVVSRLLDRGVSLRPVRMADAEMIREWRNDPAVRLNSLDPRAIAGDEHRNWTAEVLADPNRCLLVGERFGRPVGVLRYDIGEDGARVSIFLEMSARGLGIGTVMLRAGEDWLAAHRPAVTRLYADILEGNPASRGAFEKAGFSRHQVQYIKHV